MLDDYSRTDFIAAVTDIPNYSVMGYAGFGVDIGGTISTGNLQIQGSSDGKTWVTIFTADSNGAQPSSNQITAAGHYTANVIGYNMARIYPSSGFAGSVIAVATITSMSPQITATI